MIERIKKLIEQKHYTLSSFAEVTGINPTTISHIINGREIKGKGKVNQIPSTDVITKILRVFPDISAEWLIMGTGPINKEEKLPTADLFSQQHSESTKDIFRSEYARETIDKHVGSVNQTSKLQTFIPQFSLSENIDKIVIFFKNKTYITLRPEE